MSLDFENITLCAEAGNSDLDSGSDNGDDSDASAGTGDDDNASSGENESEIDEEERSGLGSGLDVFGHARWETRHRPYNIHGSINITKLGYCISMINLFCQVLI